MLTTLVERDHDGFTDRESTTLLPYSAIWIWLREEGGKGESQGL